ncbi:MAG TPA: hypothetical protein VKM54_05260 [Myxococcota bacterium]|nr:hypothetical protein [Myxococcota bacterium]
MSSIDFPSDDALRALASQILARPEYAKFRPFDVVWWVHLKSALLRLQSWVAGLDPWLYATILGGLVLLLALLIFHIVWSLRAALGTASNANHRTAKTQATALDAQARRLAEEGCFLDAAHQMHLACIDRLLREGVLELHRHDPNRTLRKRLKATSMSEDLKAVFVSLLERLERRWFRDHTADPSDRELYDEWRNLHERIESVGHV